MREGGKGVGNGG